MDSSEILIVIVSCNQLDEPGLPTSIV